MMTVRHAISALGCAALCSIVVADAHAQVRWSRTTALGYAFPGAALGVIPALDMPLDGPFWVPPAVGLFGGALAGHLVGSSADRKLAAGVELSAAHRNAVRTGTVFLGMTTGAAVAALLINPEGGSFARDETILGAGLIGGAVLGVWVQSRLEPQLRVALPEPSVEYSRERGATLVLRYALPAPVAPAAPRLPRAPAQDSAVPPVTVRAALRQTAAGFVGGTIGVAAVGVPLLFAAFSGSVEKPSDAVLVTMLGSGLVTGTTYGVHWAGRRDNMTGNPLVTAGGVLLGSAVVLASGAALTYEGDEDYAGPRVSLLLAPAIGGSAAFLATRRARQ
jgi:hypothetical protein